MPSLYQFLWAYTVLYVQLLNRLTHDCMRSQSVFCSCCRATFYRRRFQIFGRIRRVANLQQTRHCEYTAFHDARSTTTNPIPDIKTLAVSIHQRRPNPSAFFHNHAILRGVRFVRHRFIIVIVQDDHPSTRWRFGDFRAAIQLPRHFVLVKLNSFGTVRWFLLRPTAVHSVTLGPTIMGHYSFIYWVFMEHRGTNVLANHDFKEASLKGLLQLRLERDSSHDSSAIRARYEHDTLQHATRFFVRSHTRPIRALHENQW